MENKMCKIELLGKESCLWRYTEKSTGRSWDFAPPTFQVGGESKPAVIRGVSASGEPVELPNGAAEYTYTGTLAMDANLILEMTFCLLPDNPVVRFRYRLKAKSTCILTKRAGSDDLQYFRLSFANLPICKEVRFSEFDELTHSYRLTEHNLPERDFSYELTVMGPMLVASNGTHTILVAYEHGSQVPDAFLQYHLSPDHSVVLKATKGNYYNGQTITTEQPYETIWLQFAGAKGSEELLANYYRSFILKVMTLNAESRKPYIFYNTWNYQERNKHWNGKNFLDSMCLERILNEIYVAHRMGIDVFVLDTGWYEKTGDWQPSKTRFPDGFHSVKECLNRYGMKLGLWFSPTQAAVSSRIVQEHSDCRVSWNGQVEKPHPVWETEESYRMCLVSGYWKEFADELIRVNKELGVTYFKWDAIEQYICNAPAHWHGTEANSPQERADCYAFEMVRYMTRIVDRVSNACPEVIVDFDITEAHRCVGLSFLSSGKYFLINNGPYFGSYDCPERDRWSNVYVYPGPARARVCRSPLVYDKWIPSVLFLTHYLPDDPHSSQIINLASLILGQNGIWGDLLNVSEEGVKLFGKVLGLYKQVRDDITASFPVRTGIVGGSPEIHEKVSQQTGRGAVAIFTDAVGRYTYVTSNPVAETYWATGGLEVIRYPSGQSRLEITFHQPGAALVFFGVKP